MKRVLLIFLVLVSMLLGACSTHVAAPNSTSATTPAPVSPPTLTPTPIYTLNVSLAPQEGASVSLSPPGGAHEAGVQVTLTATPPSGFTFDYWDGDVTGTTSTINITMNSNKSITAHFKVSDIIVSGKKL